MREEIETEAQAGRCVILLAVHNGARFLPEQLDSFAAQSHRAWDLIASDDGSEDESAAQLAAFADRMRDRGHCVDIVPGPAAGHASANFLTLLSRTDGADWVAFADQDDVWLPEKLSAATAMLAGCAPETPTLYCSRTWITGTDLQDPVPSRRFARAFGFRNALVQNIAAGNTIVLNRAAADTARKAAAAALEVARLPAHDWWLYQLITGAGGRILHDDTPRLYYRQHGGNQIGAHRGTRAALVRLRALLSGRFRAWNAENIAALEAAGDLLTEENRAVLRSFAALRGMRFRARLAAFGALGLYRQTRLAQAATWLAVALGRI